MPIIRKVISVGKSRAVTLPKTWLEYVERELDQEVRYVAIEVNGELRISPYTQADRQIETEED